MNFAGKTVAIFGCGYLGSRIAAEALERGLRVSALTRNAARADRFRRSGVHRVVEASLEERDWHARIDPVQDFVLDCVGAAAPGPEGYRRSYVEGMRSLLAWSAGGTIGTLVFTGSTSVYGQDEERWVTEEDAADGSSDGSRILLEAERLLLDARSGIARKFVLRLGGIYGPGRHHLLDRAAGGPRERRAGDRVMLNAVRVEDAAEAVWAAFGSGAEIRGGIFNVVDDAPTRKAEILDYLVERLESGGYRLKSGAEETVRRRRTGERPSRKISNEKARTVLGWTPRHADYRAGYESLLAAWLDADRAGGG